MPLPAPVSREQLHTRRYHFDGFRRHDGLWDIDGRITDVKTYGFPNRHRGRIEAGEPLHDMSIRLTVDDDFVVRDIEAVTDAGPYGVCPNITPNFKRMIGVTVGPGWRRAVRQRVGGTEGCTHLVELLIAMATVAFQTIYPAKAGTTGEAARNSNGTGRTERPALLDTCHAFASDGELVKQYWPEFYTGE